ncbi:hypothetical protein MHYP_G00259780 [Metynnis hypsauchen]
MGHDIRVPCDFHRGIKHFSCQGSANFSRQRRKKLRPSSTRISTHLTSHFLVSEAQDPHKDRPAKPQQKKKPDDVESTNERTLTGDEAQSLTKKDGAPKWQRRKETGGDEETEMEGSFAPVDLVFGAPPGDEAGCEPGPKFVTDLLDTLHNVHHAARVHLSDASLKQKRAYDTRCSGEPLVVGQSVWLFSPKCTRGLCPKLQSNWVGACSVVSKLGEVVYRVKWGKRRLVVHRDRLAPYRPKQRLCGQDINPLSPPSPERSQVDPTGSIDCTHVPAPTAPPAVGDAVAGPRPPSAKHHGNGYKESAMRLSRIHHDRPVKPLVEAVSWIEYVMRNKGAGHLRVASHSLTWYQYHCLDVLVFLISILALVFYIIIRTCSFLIRRCCRAPKHKSKSE